MNAGKLTIEDLVHGLRELGLSAGDKVLVHSSLAAIGPVDGGADAVIEALLKAVGPDGLVAVPTFGSPQPFDRKSSSTPLGAVADSFWRRSEAVRSLHPTHSIAAIGKGAHELVEGHEKAPTGYAEGTPYYKLAAGGGKVLLLGVDQDRNTTLHAAEAICCAPYLDDVEADYIDDSGKKVTIRVSAMAGPHRNFIGLDPLFRGSGLMKIGRIGNAVCRLMDGKKMLDTAIEAIKSDPAAVLCENPACLDCVIQRARIKEFNFSQESYTLSAVAGDISEDPETIINALKCEGISSVEITAKEYVEMADTFRAAGIKIVGIRSSANDLKSADLAARINIPVIVPVGDLNEFEMAVQMLRTGANVYIENNGGSSAEYTSFIQSVKKPPKLAFNPAWFAAAGEKPFLEVFYKGTLRKHIAHFYVDDGTFDGTSTLPGYGNGEVKEIISMLRCRSYNGIVSLRSHTKGADAFKEVTQAFRKLSETM